MDYVKELYPLALGSIFVQTLIDTHKLGVIEEQITSIRAEINTWSADNNYTLLSQKLKNAKAIHSSLKLRGIVDGSSLVIMSLLESGMLNELFVNPIELEQAQICARIAGLVYMFGNIINHFYELSKES